MTAHLIDEDQMANLKRLCEELHGGTDRERDYGHRLWLIYQQIAQQTT
jgi:hypothetical protein